MQVIGNREGVVDKEIRVGSWTVVLEERSRGDKIHQEVKRGKGWTRRLYAERAWWRKKIDVVESLCMLKERGGERKSM